MGTKKKSAKKLELEEDTANVSIASISDNDEEANKDLSLEIIQKALLNRATNPQNDAVLNSVRVKSASKVHSDEIKSEMKKKKKKRKKLGSEIETAVIFEEEKENVETIKAAETCMVDTSDNVVPRTVTPDLLDEEIRTLKKKKKKKKHESEAVIVEEEGKKAVKKIKAPKKVEPAEVEKGVVDTSDNDALRNTGTESLSEEIKVKTQKKKKKSKHESEIQTVNPVIVKEEEKEAVDTIQSPEKVVPGEAEIQVVDTKDNVVLRKLLRGPRYFDPPSESVWGVWGTCFNCGEEGHASFNCTAAKRRKPCFVCGSLSHNVKKCTMARYCKTCKLVGHRSKDCPKTNTTASNSKSLTICMKCGNSGHDMFLCKKDYSQDDLKEIQCYVCKKFGHLCCVDTTDAMPNEHSCYKCGQMGHIGWACSRLQNQNADADTPSLCYKCGEKGHFARECSSSVKASSKPETTYPSMPSSCYRCGEEGHFSRECSSSVKVGNQKHKFSSTETPRFQKENDYMGYCSAPQDNGMNTPKRSKHGGGWMTDQSGEFSPSNSKRDSWRSPVTPYTNSTNNNFYNSGNHSFNSKSYKMRNDHYGTPNSGGSGRNFHHRYSASRFGNSGSNGFERSYNWW